MNMPAADLADTATTPAALIERVRATRTIADTAELQILQLAIEWAHAHPVIDECGLEVTWRLSPDPIWHPGEYDASVAGATDVEEVEWCGIPPVRWDAPAAFAAAKAPPSLISVESLHCMTSSPRSS